MHAHESEVSIKDISAASLQVVGLKVWASATGLWVSPIVLADTIRTLSGPPAAVLLFSCRLALGLHVLECDSRPILERCGCKPGVCEVGNPHAGR